MYDDSRSRQQILQRLMSPSQEHGDEAEWAEHGLDEEADQRAEEVRFSTVIRDDDQVETPMPDGCAPFPDEQRFVQKYERPHERGLDSARPGHVLRQSADDENER